MSEFMREHFTDCLLVALMVFFTGVSLACVHWHFDKGFDIFSAAAVGQLLGALVMKLRASPATTPKEEGK